MDSGSRYRAREDLDPALNEKRGQRKIPSNGKESWARSTCHSTAGDGPPIQRRRHHEGEGNRKNPFAITSGIRRRTVMPAEKLGNNRFFMCETAAGKEKWNERGNCGILWRSGGNSSNSRERGLWVRRHAQVRGYHL